MDFGRVVCVGLLDLLAQDERGRGRDRAHHVVNDWLLLCCTAFATPAAAQPGWFLAGSGSSTVASVIPYWSSVFAMQFMNTVGLRQLVRELEGAVHRRPPTSAGNVVVPSMGCPDRRSSGTGRPRRTSRARGRRDRTSGDTRCRAGRGAGRHLLLRGHRVQHGRLRLDRPASMLIDSAAVAFPGRGTAPSRRDRAARRRRRSPGPCA